jgi:uroporphyrinogen III methyltransferase/synthase
MEAPQGPLAGWRVLVTRALDQAAETVTLLRARGAEPVIFPAIEIHPPRDPARFAKGVRDTADEVGPLCVVFTSANGVERTIGELARQGTELPAGARIAAVGSQTARALETHGQAAEIVAKEFKQEGLAEAILSAYGDARAKVVLFRAEVARDALPDALRNAGFVVEVVVAYETRKPDPARAAELARDLAAGALDAVTFTSGSTAENTCDMLGPRAAELLGRVVVASIGPVTTKACEARGVRVDVTAREATVPGLVKALENHVSKIDKASPGQRSLR